MWFLVLINFYLGFEGGINLPVIGLDYDLKSGNLFRVYIGKNDLKTGIYWNLVLGGSYYYGRNPGYSLRTYGVRLMGYKVFRSISPYLETGIDYIKRTLEKNSEWGFGFEYAIGFLINFNYENITFYPAFYYDGVTDFKSHAGSAGVKLGLKYEW
ncbi:MAG: hypothetical protein ABIL39_01140 [candidate division WOR-3 bacterium]